MDRYVFRSAFRTSAAAATILSALAAGLVPGSAAASVTGRLVVPAVSRAPQQASVSPYPGMEVPAAASEARTATAADAVVWIEKLTAADAPAPAGPLPELRQVQYAFKPRVLGIPAGTTVEFPNEDAVFHNVFSYSKTKRFDLGYYGKGKSKQVTFDKPGLIKVFCDIHSSMSAFILVVDSRFVSSPTGDGRFAFDGVPDGTWKLRVWHPELGEVSRQITVAQGDATVEIRY